MLKHSLPDNLSVLLKKDVLVVHKKGNSDCLSEQFAKILILMPEIKNKLNLMYQFIINITMHNIYINKD